MILRKPYAFLIKHFRLIHVVLAFLSLYTIFKTKVLLDFLNGYASDMINLVGQDLIPDLVPRLYVIAPLFIIIATLIVLAVMLTKKKPIVFYAVNIILYTYVLVVIFVSQSTLETLSRTILDVKTIRLIRDLNTLSFMLQFVSVIIITIRAIGFDVKKFNFKQDLKELEIDEADREEFEVEFNFDKNEIIKNLKKKKRYLIYSYRENKALYRIFLAGTLILGIYVIYINFLARTPTIKQGVMFSGNGFTLKVEDSYLTNSDYMGNVIDDNYYLAIKLKIKSNKKPASLDLATAKIVVGPYYFIPITYHKEKFKDLGTIYQSEKIQTEYENITLLYQIPKQIIDNDIIFAYVNKNSVGDKEGFKSTNVKINYKNLMNGTTRKALLMGEDVDFEDSVLNDYSLHIDSFDIKKNFKIEYKHCYSGDCYQSYEYIKPKLNTNYDKVLLKVTGKIVYNNATDGIYDLYDFIEYFGQINYVTSDGTKTIRIKDNEIVSSKTTKKNDYYIEVPADILDATSLSIIFDVRTNKYEYILK